MNQLDQMQHTVEAIEAKLGLGSASASSSGGAVESPSPADQVLLQQQGQQKFIGNLFWDAINLITFGAFEKKKEPKKAPENNDAQKQNEAK